MNMATQDRVQVGRTNATTNTNTKTNTNKSRTRTQQTGAAQLGGILASLNINSLPPHEDHHHHHNDIDIDIHLTSPPPAKTRNYTKNHHHPPKLPTHLHVPKHHDPASFMSPLQSPKFATMTSKSKSNRTKDDHRTHHLHHHRRISLNESNVTSHANHSPSDSDRSSSNSNSRSSSSSVDVTTPSSKSHTLGSETESEATEFITGVGLKRHDQSSCTSEEYEEEDEDESSASASTPSSASASASSSSSGNNRNKNGNRNHKDYFDKHGDDDTYAGASYIVQEEYVPYGRVERDAKTPSSTSTGTGTSMNAHTYADADADADGDIDQQTEDTEDHSYANASYIVKETYVPYGRSIKQTRKNGEYCDDSEYDDDEVEEDGYESPMAEGVGADSHANNTYNDDDDDNNTEGVQEAIVLDQDSDVEESTSIVSVEIESLEDSVDDHDSSASVSDSYEDETGNSSHGAEIRNKIPSKRSYSNMDSYRDMGGSMNSSTQDTNHSDRRSRYAASNTSFASSSSIVRRGKWSMGSRIGQGSFGVVHTAMNNLTGKLMAVKSMNIASLSSASSSSSSKTLLEDLRREIDLMKSLQHPNIVRYFGCEMDREKEMLHIFQEWVPGGSIASLLNKFGPFPLTVVRTYLYQAIQGLSYLHEHHILHRDIKGGNLLVNDEGIVKLADFGTSKRLQVSPDGSALDMDAEDVMANMTMCGTPFFMAPEVFEEQYGSKADVWSCACVAHQMCTGSPPWKGLGIKGPVRLFSYIMEHEGPPPVIMEVDGDDDGEGGSMNKSLADLLEQCFQRKPSKRPSTQTLLQHHFFQESDSNECITEDGSVPGGSVLGSRSACSPISPQKLVHLKTAAAQEEPIDTIHNKQEVMYDSHGWPAWAKSNFADTKLPEMQRN